MALRLGYRAALVAALCSLPAVAGAVEALRILPPEAVAVKPGAATQIRLQVVVRPGYHVQANPVENPSLIPITLRIDPSPHISIGVPRYPGAKRLRLAGDDQDLVVYDGRFDIALPIAVGNDAAPGDVTLAGSLRYQACDDRHCLFPVTLPVAVSVTVLAP